MFICACGGLILNIIGNLSHSLQTCSCIMNILLARLSIPYRLMHAYCTQCFVYMAFIC